MTKVFRDRQSAGCLLAEEVAMKEPLDSVVVAVPRGGIPVAAEISRAFCVPLKICITTRITFPSNPKLSAGAQSYGGEAHLDPFMLQFLSIPESAISASTQAAQAKLESLYREFAVRAANACIEGKNILIVDDAVATGTSIFEAIRHLQLFKPSSVCVAAPVISQYASLQLTEKKIDYTTIWIPSEAEFRPQNYYRNFDAVDSRSCENILAMLK